MSKQIMIVDDEPVVREMISRYFARQGLDALAADGCDQCIEYFKNGFKGVVLMDLIMPGKDGWDTINEIIKQGYSDSAVIVLLTASTKYPPSKAMSIKQHVTDYIPKPVRLEVLDECVKNYLKYFDKS
ncbi:MAG: response regulator [Endomicrobiales bacterium]|nr:response regulator [Endomicrobiales bacterium]